MCKKLLAKNALIYTHPFLSIYYLLHYHFNFGPY